MFNDKPTISELNVNKIAAIRAVREELSYRNIGLKEAKDAVEIALSYVTFYKSERCSLGETHERFTNARDFRA